MHCILIGECWSEIDGCNLSHPRQDLPFDGGVSVTKWRGIIHGSTLDILLLNSDTIVMLSLNLSLPVKSSR